MNAKIKDHILGYKNEYENAKNKAEKEEIIKEVRYGLKEKYGIDGRSDWRATAVCIKKTLEVGVLWNWGMLKH